MTADDQLPLEAAMAVLEDVVSKLPTPLSYKRLKANNVTGHRQALCFEGDVYFVPGELLPQEWTAPEIGGTVLVDAHGFTSTALLTKVDYTYTSTHHRYHWCAMAPQ